MAAAALATFVFTAALYGDLATHLGEHFPLTTFDRGHFRVYESVLGGDLGLVATDVAWPVGGHARVMGWVGIVMTGCFEIVCDPLAAYVISVWCGPALGAAFAVLLIRRLTTVGAVPAAILAPVAALSPVVVGFLRSGQTAKSQLWTVELVLLVVLGLLERPTALRLLALVAASALVGVQAPPLALLLPFAVLVPLLGQTVPWRGRLWRAGAVVLAVGLGVAGPAAYTASGVPPSGGGPVVRREPDDPVYLMIPAQNPDSSVGGARTPSVAEPRGSFLGPPAPGPLDAPDAGVHVTYLGVPLLALGAWAWRRRGAGRGFGAGLAATGVAVAMGPYLAWGPAFVDVAGRRFPGLAYPLRLLHYPLSDSGLWYRALVLVGPGVVVLLASGLSTLRRPWATPVAILIAFVLTLDTVRALSPLLPIPSESVAGRAELARIAADETRGAVLDLPFERSQLDAEAALLRAALHRRPSSVVPNHTMLGIYPHLQRLDRELRAALASSDVASALRSLGFAWVILDTEVVPPPPPNQRLERERAAPAAAVTEAALSAGLGPPTSAGALRFWRVAGE